MQDVLESQSTTINGYPVHLLRDALFSRLRVFTRANYLSKIETLNANLAKIDEPLWISLGENCGPAIKLREAGLVRLGGFFFDNLVAPIESLVDLLRSDFSDLLLLRNLVIREWEGHRSVYDLQYGIFWHHHFHLRGYEKLVGERPSRLIEEADIPLFLPQVLSEFTYLAEKFRLVCRSSAQKNFVIRRVDGLAVPEVAVRRVRAALDHLGASNYRIILVYSAPGATYPADVESHHKISEDGERWGPTSAWASLQSTLDEKNGL